MTDVTNEQTSVRVAGTDADLVQELAEQARAEGPQLTGEGELLGRLTRIVVEGALEGEMDDHLGYEKNDPAGRNGGNSRNGYRAKTAQVRRSCQRRLRVRETLHSSG